MAPTQWLVAAAAVGSCAICIAVMAGLIRSDLAQRIVDRPNARSMHQRPTPRIGGLAILGAIAISAAVVRADFPATGWLALAALAAVSLVDDVRGLPAGGRLLAHLLIAVAAARAFNPESGLIWTAAWALALAWMINLYNFMDGSDALAGLQGLFGFGSMSLAGLSVGQLDLAMTCASIAGACTGFLLFNWPPASVFMGDAGSTVLGFLAGGVGLWGIHLGVWSPVFPLLAFLPFIVDASLTLADRFLRRQKVWQAHRDHAYQRLNLSGWGHRDTALLYGIWMALSAGTALLNVGKDPNWAMCTFMVTASVALYGIVRMSPWLHRNKQG